VIERLCHQLKATADAVLSDLLEELRSYPALAAPHRLPAAGHDYGGAVVPLKLVTEGRVFAFFSTTTVFGALVDITLSELAIEAFHPADAATAAAMRRIAEG
jgi:hypothetical protein